MLYSCYVLRCSEGEDSLIRNVAKCLQILVMSFWSHPVRWRPRFLWYVDHNMAPESRQQSTEFLRRLDLKCQVRLPPDVPSAEACMAVMRTTSGPQIGVQDLHNPTELTSKAAMGSAYAGLNSGGVMFDTAGASRVEAQTLVAQDVSRKDWMQNADAKAAVQKEWDRLLARRT